MTCLWILLGIVYIAPSGLLPGDVSQRAPLGVLDRLFIPILWIIGALIAPTRDAASRAATGGVWARASERASTTTCGPTWPPDGAPRNGGAVAVPHPFVAKRVARGRAVRAQVLRYRHAVFEPSPDRVDPVKLLERQTETRPRTGRNNGYGTKREGLIVLDTVAGYRSAMTEFAGMKNPDVCHSRLEIQSVVDELAPLVHNRHLGNRLLADGGGLEGAGLVVGSSRNSGCRSSHESQRLTTESAGAC